MKANFGKWTAGLAILASFSAVMLPSCDYSQNEPIPSMSASPSQTTASPGVTLPPGTELTFETVIESGNLGGSYKGESAQILVISNFQTPLPEELEWVKPEHQTKILEVDYSNYLVVMVLNGYRGGIFSKLNIQRIWQNAGIVFVLAHFDDFVPGATSLPAYNSQYKAVKISKEQIASGANTFKLLDESGNERATATYEVLK